MVLTLVIFSWTALITLFSAMQIHMKLGYAMEQTIEEFAMLAYLTEIISMESDKVDFFPEEAGDAVNSYDIDAYLQTGVTIMALRSRILMLVGREALDASCIRGGSQGITMLGSSGLTEEGDIDVCLTYQIEIPFVPAMFSYITMTQRAVRHAWIGASPDDGSDDGEGVIGDAVYVTENGTVYHESTSCTHLNLSVRLVDLGDVEYLRSQDGSRYYPCERCMSGAEAGSVYITSEGNRYHSDIGCGSLKRTVEAVEKSEVNLPACSKCSSDGE